MSRSAKVLIASALVPVVAFNVFILLRVCGLVRPFFVPTVTMTPAISAGDRVMTEGITYLSRKPRRGEIVVFITDGIPTLPSGSFYVKRVAGEPGDRVRISGGKLFINEKQVPPTNPAQEIAEGLPSEAMPLSPPTDLTVPSGCYFVLGDNSRNSADSRYWGCVPRNNIVGRVSFCFWPPNRFGRVK